MALSLTQVAAQRQALLSDLEALSLAPPMAVGEDPPLDDNIIVIDIPELGAPARHLTNEYNTVPVGVHMMNVKKGKKGRTLGTSNGLSTISANPRLTYCFRYSTDGDGTSNVKVSDLARSMVAASANTAFRYLFRTIKIARVTIRGSAGAIGGSTTVSLKFLGENTDETTYMDSTMKVDTNAMVSRAPPRFSLASYWHDITSSTDNEKTLFQLTTKSTGAGVTFVDLHLNAVFDEERYIDYTISNNALNLNAGGIYYGRLSSNTPSYKAVGRQDLGT